MLRKLWQRLLAWALCSQGLHGGNIVRIDNGDSYELYCTRCGYTSYANDDGIWWGYDR